MPRFSHPSNVVQFNKSEGTEWPIKGSIPYSHRPDHMYVTHSLKMASSLSDRFNCAIDGNTILIFDLFLGIKKKLMPKEAHDVLEILLYIYLSPSRGFLIYRTAHQEQASIVSIDVDGKTYDFIGKSYDIIPSLYVFCYNFCSSSHTVFINNGGKDGLFIFDLDPSSLNIKSFKQMDIPKKSFLYTRIDGNLIFANFGDNGYSGGRLNFNLNNFQIAKDDNSFVKIEDTGVQIASDEVEIVSAHRSRNKVHGCWSNKSAFVFYNRIDVEVLHQQRVKNLISNPSIFMFEFEKKTWSKICLNLTLNCAFYNFVVCDNGILNVMIYSKNGGDGDELLGFSTSLVRIPLQRPDKLINLCWFQARKFGLSDKLIHLKNFV